VIGVPGFTPRPGVHCETVATGNLLRHAGIDLSEPMLFGLGEGLGFVLLNLRDLPLPFIGGRTKPFDLTRTLCRALGVRCVEHETTSRARAWRQLAEPLHAGRPVGLQLDSYHLEYFTERVHFAGHCVAAYGLDGDDVLLVDTRPAGGAVRCSRGALEAARFATGPMAARARSWTVEVPVDPAPLPDALLGALRGNATTYLAPGFGGAGARGIRGLARSLPGWLDGGSDPAALCTVAGLVEHGGTGGSLFRRLYADFVAEAAGHLPEHKAVLEDAGRELDAAAREWSAVAAALDESGRTGDRTPLVGAAAACRRIADLEEGAMTRLAALPPVAPLSPAPAAGDQSDTG
jgi:hypothetical protein